MDSRDVSKHGTARRLRVETPPKELPPFRPDRVRPQVPDDETGEAAPRFESATQRWSLAFAILATLALVATLFVYVLRPAITTIVDPTASTWSAEGP
jgi:hypothetical protein